MNILISNDDGYQAEGLNTLIHALSGFAKVTAVAPEINRSGASNSLTLDLPLRLSKHSDILYSVNGTPTDCVHLALTGLLKEPPDIVVSGINHGENLGDDTLYSGTVAAAMEGRFLGLPSIAVSLASPHPKHFNSAAQAVLELLQQMEHYPVDKDTILNINVPDRPWDQIQGFKCTYLGRRNPSAPAVRSEDSRGREIFWVGQLGSVQNAEPGTDFHALQQGYISVTPLHIDLTRYNTLTATQQWLERI